MADIEKHNPTSPVSFELINDLRQIIDAARSHVAATANYELTMMYWHIGNRINNEVLGNERAEYGQQIVSAVSTQLQTEYGKKGFEPRSIWRMMQFAQEFPDFKIVSAVATQITWSHVIEIYSRQRNPHAANAKVPRRRERDSACRRGMTSNLSSIFGE